MGEVMTVNKMSTIENDGSVSEDPCQACDGRLVLRRAPSGGFFLGCTKYSRGCTFKMAPNSEELADREEAKAKRLLERERKRAERDAEYRRKKEEQERLKPPPPKFCEECFSRLSNVEVQAGLDKHRYC